MACRKKVLKIKYNIEASLLRHVYPINAEVDGNVTLSTTLNVGKETTVERDGEDLICLSSWVSNVYLI